MYLNEQNPSEMFTELYSDGRLFLYKHDLIEELTSKEMTMLYKTTCTRRCHSSDVVETRPRTALEWDWIMTRMKAPDRANINDHHATAITRYLQEFYLSNVPTIMPEKTMRFVKRYLWQSDFGENDLYLDIIYLPHLHQSLLPYLIATNSPPVTNDTIFIIFINTHQGEIPPWNLEEMVTLGNGGNSSLKPTGWKLIYEDGQGHHKQGILTFPAIDDSQTTTLDINVKLPGVRERIFQWNLPIPLYRESDHAEN
jgi:hypothetical protein